MNYRMFSLGSNDTLSARIAERIRVSLGAVTCKTFADGEQHVQFGENLRGTDVFIIQSTNPPAEHWVQLLLAIEAARGASAREITAVIPYFGYARQDRKARPREPISARVFAQSMEAVGVDRVLTLDLHNDAIAGFFRNTIVDSLYARPVFLSFFEKIFAKELENKELVMVAPDAGSVVRVQSYAKRLTHDVAIALIHKEREVANRIKAMKLVGDVTGKTALIIDDMADTCGTLVAAAETLSAHGAREVIAATTHGLLSGNAQEKIDNSSLTRFYVTDSVEQKAGITSPKIEVVSVADLIGDAIMRISTGESLSALFEPPQNTTAQ